MKFTAKTEFTKDPVVDVILEYNDKVTMKDGQIECCRVTFKNKLPVPIY